MGKRSRKRRESIRHKGHDRRGRPRRNSADGPQPDEQDYFEKHVRQADLGGPRPKQ